MDSTAANQSGRSAFCDQKVPASAVNADGTLASVQSGDSTNITIKAKDRAATTDGTGVVEADLLTSKLPTARKRKFTEQPPLDLPSIKKPPAAQESSSDDDAVLAAQLATWKQESDHGNFSVCASNAAASLEQSSTLIEYKIHFGTISLSARNLRINIACFDVESRNLGVLMGEYSRSSPIVY